MNLEDEFGDVIAKARVGQGCAPEALASAAGLSPERVRDIESYRFAPDDDSVRLLAQVLELNPEKLLDSARRRWQPEPVDLARGTITIDRVETPAGGYSENCYVVTSRSASLAAVVDPGGAVDGIESLIAGRGAVLDAVLITHAHSDHTGGLKDVARKWPNARLVSAPVERDSVIRGLNLHWQPASDGVTIRWGDLGITPMATPGHTPGSTCFAIDGACFVGDTLFAGSIGRPAGPMVYRRMLESIRAKVLSLQDDTVLLPGHGPVTDVRQEKDHNPFF